MNDRGNAKVMVLWIVFIVLSFTVSIFFLLFEEPHRIIYDVVINLLPAGEYLETAEKIRTLWMWIPILALGAFGLATVYATITSSNEGGGVY